MGNTHHPTPSPLQRRCGRREAARSGWRSRRDPCGCRTPPACTHPPSGTCVSPTTNAASTRSAAAWRCRVRGSDDGVLLVVGDPWEPSYSRVPPPLYIIQAAAHAPHGWGSRRHLGFRPAGSPLATRRACPGVRCTPVPLALRGAWWWWTSRTTVIGSSSGCVWRTCAQPAACPRVWCSASCSSSRSSSAPTRTGACSQWTASPLFYAEGGCSRYRCWHRAWRGGV